MYVNEEGNLFQPKLTHRKVFAHRNPSAFADASRAVVVILTHYRTAMPFRNRNKYFRGSFLFSIVSKIYHPSGSPKFNYLGIFKSFKIAYGKIPFDFSQAKFHSKYFGPLWVNFMGERYSRR